jgi:hypothetical protein
VRAGGAGHAGEAEDVAAAARGAVVTAVPPPVRAPLPESRAALGLGAGAPFGETAVGVVTGSLVVVGELDVDADVGVGAAASWADPQAASVSATAVRSTRVRTPHVRTPTGRFGRVTPALTPACVWRTTPALLVALDERFGEPTDAYVNGSQVWLRDDGPGETTIEWRLHPVADYRRPAATDTYDVFASVALAVARDEPPIAPPAELWDGLEAFPAFGDETEPATLAAACAVALGIAPDASGLVDHQSVADEWERARGGVSIFDALLQQLSA